MKPLGSLAEKKNVYYGDFPPELMDEMWRRFRLALEPLRHAESWVPSCFNSLPGSSIAARTCRTSRVALKS